MKRSEKDAPVNTQQELKTSKLTFTAKKVPEGSRMAKAVDRCPL